MATVQITKGAPQTSLRAFLAETAISVFVLAVLLTTNPWIQGALGSAIPGNLALLVGVLILFSTYPVGLAVNGFSYLLLSKAIQNAEKKLFDSPTACAYTKELLEFDRSKDRFCIDGYDDYNRRVRLLEEFDSMLERFGVDQSHTVGLEQFARNLAFALPLMALTYIPPVAMQISMEIAWAKILIAVAICLVTGVVLSALTLRYAAFVRFYRGVFYLCSLIELQRYYFLEEESKAHELKDDEREFYASISRLAAYEQESGDEG